MAKPPPPLRVYVTSSCMTKHALFCKLGADWEPTLREYTRGEDPFEMNQMVIMDEWGFFTHYPRIVRSLGSGAYGQVFLVQDAHGVRNQEYDRQFAIKLEFMLPEDIVDMDSIDLSSPHLSELLVHHFLTVLFAQNKANNAKMRWEIIPVAKLFDYGRVSIKLDNGNIPIPNDADKMYIEYVKKLQDVVDDKLPAQLRNANSANFSVLVMENGEKTLENYLSNLGPHQFYDLFMNSMHHILTTLMLLGEQLAFTHWDLKSNNVMIMVAPPLPANKLATLLRYRDVNNNVHVVRVSNGRYPAMIDFGLSSMRFNRRKPNGSVQSYILPGDGGAYLKMDLPENQWYNPTFDMFRLVTTILARATYSPRYASGLPLSFYSVVRRIMFQNRLYNERVETTLDENEVKSFKSLRTLLENVETRYAGRKLGERENDRFEDHLANISKLAGELANSPIFYWSDLSPTPRDVLTKVEEFYTWSNINASLLDDPEFDVVDVQLTQ